MSNYISDSIKGTQREENKDRILIIRSDDYFIAIVFDGISSAPEANDGIDIAVHFISEHHKKFFNNKKYSLGDLMYWAHCSILKSNLNSPYSTFSAACISNDKKWGVLSNLGDSRIYEITPQNIRQLSIDDNLSVQKNVVTRYLGMLELNRDDFANIDYDIDEKKILLCSDGFYSLFENDLIRFHSIFNLNQGENLKEILSNEITNKNPDDASYVFIF